MTGENKDRQNPGESEDDFAAGAEERPSNVFVEFKDFLLYNKKWWLLPIVIVLSIVAVFVLLAGSPLAPFIYTIF